MSGRSYIKAGLTWAFGGLRATAAAGLVTGVFIVAVGMTPGQAFAYFWRHPPIWLFAWQGRALMIVAGLLIIGWSLHLRRDDAERLGTALEKRVKWLSPLEARAAFADPDSVKTLEFCHKVRLNAASQSDAAERNLGAITAQTPREECERLSRTYQEANATYGHAISKFDRALEAADNDMWLKLQRGFLVAKGFRHSGAQEIVEKIIPTSEWRVLVLDYRDEVAAGAGIEYHGVVIGKKRSGATD